MALEKANGEWIYQLDADEVTTSKLAKEILAVINMDNEELRLRRPEDMKKWKLFTRHQKAIEKRDGQIGKKTGEIVAFFIPRINMFLGAPLKYAGVYPDPAIRLVKKGKAFFPAVSVHEIMKIDGEVAWLFNDMEHFDSPTLRRYLERANRYTSLTAKDFKEKGVSKNLIKLFYYSVTKPIMVFMKLYLRHKGFKDGIRGFLWSIFSALHFPLAYYKYYTE